MLRPIVSLGAGLLLLSGCHTISDIVAPADLKLPPVVLAWLPDQDGQALVFQDGAGRSQTLRVARQQRIEQLVVSKVSPVKRGVETLYLAYRGLPAQPAGFSVTTTARSEQDVADPTVLFYCADAPVNTSGVPANVPVAATLNLNPERANPAAALQYTYAIGPRTYAAVLHAESIATQQGISVPTALQEVFFARDKGLVAFKTLDGQLWLRQ